MSRIFISYSRRQLYFAEALALHLQARGLPVWFDLQQLHVGGAWQSGLQQGVQAAGPMVLVVSKASLDSPWTRAEWEGRVAGGGLVLAVFEAVDLPEVLRGLPTYDFRADFDASLARLADYLEGHSAPRHDPVPRPNRFGLPLRLPPVLWAMLVALAAPLVFALAAALKPWLDSKFDASDWLAACGVAVALWLTLRRAPAFWRRSLAYKALKRGLLGSVLLSLPLAVTAGVLWKPILLNAAMAAAWLALLILYLGPLRRSATLLRWMPPDEDLQPLRRRVHQRLLARGEVLPDGAAETSAPAAAAGVPAPFTYALHAADADRPLERRVQSLLDAAGHRRVAVGARGNAAHEDQPDHHIVILTNRSSQSWIQALTEAHARAGRLICLVASTIEIGERLADTARYQWVDFRDGDPRDIESLARSLDDPQGAQRHRALEVTPEAIDRWKVPSGVRLLRTVTELFGMFALVFALSDFAGVVLDGKSSHPTGYRSALLALNGGVLLWLGSQALVHRRLTAAQMYPLLIGAVVACVSSAKTLPAFLQERPWLVLAVYLTFVLYSLIDGRHWLPAPAPRLPDEVGVKASIERDFRRRYVLRVGGWIVGLTAAAVLIKRSAAACARRRG